MWKRIVACIMIAISLLSLGNFSYATNVVDTTKYEILNPEKASYSTKERVVLINGKAPSGTEVTIDVYGTTDSIRRITNSDKLAIKKDFNLDKLPTAEDYILLLSEKVTSGNLGLFQKQLDLIKGINKIVINFGVEGVETKEIIIYVYNRDRIVTRESNKISEILPLLR